MRSTCLLLAVLGLSVTEGATGAAAREQSPIPGVGMMGDIPGAHEQPDPSLDYKIVFDVQTLADSADEVDPALRAMAGLINTFRHGGVPASHMHLAAMFHGGTIVLVTNDQVYRQRTRAEANPNAALLRQLKDAGVVLAVCGQSARAQHYADDALLPFVQSNLSATVTFINLQTRGYVRVTE